MKKNIALLLILIHSAIPALAERGGGVGNGGDGIFCSWRKPMTLDFYSIGFAGGNLYGKRSKITDVYSSPLTVNEIILNVLTKLKQDQTPGLTINSIDIKQIAPLIKRIKKGLALHSDYSQWNEASTLPSIPDSLHDYFLPKGCEVKQVAQAIDGHINVDSMLFKQLDERQKEFLAIHEAIYWVGRTYYGHDNSFFTSNLIRALMRRTGVHGDWEIYDAIYSFTNNLLPAYMENLNEEQPGSAGSYNWSLNFFDLNGEFTADPENQEYCPTSVNPKIKPNLNYDIELIFKSSKKHSQGADFPLMNEVDQLYYLNQSGFLRAHEIESLRALSRTRYLNVNEDSLSIVGLNNDDDFFFYRFNSVSWMRPCFYHRRIQ